MLLKMGFGANLTVIISVYDDRVLVEQKLAEISGQSAFKTSNFIFIEPNSPGFERELIKPFCESNENCRLITLNERITLYEAWNLGWENASTKYVCISNMDDRMHPELLESVAEAMEEKKCDLLSVLIAKESLGTTWDELEGRCLCSLNISRRPGPFFAWKRSIKDSLGMFDSEMTVAGDKDFWARASFLKLRMYLLPRVLYIYSKHPDQLSKNDAFKMQKAKDLERSHSKEYSHRWPVSIQSAIRWESAKFQLQFWRCLG
jgi:hypothetical protein